MKIINPLKTRTKPSTLTIVRAFIVCPRCEKKIDIKRYEAKVKIGEDSMNKRRLKCPKCQGHNAWVELLYNEHRDEYYRQKFCGCGYAGARRYTQITRERMLELRKAQ